MTTDSTPEDAQTGLYMPPSLAKRLELLDDVAGEFDVLVDENADGCPFQLSAPKRKTQGMRPLAESLVPRLY